MSENNQKYADATRQLIPINELPQEVQNGIIQNAVLIEVKKKGFIFNQGDRDSYSYCLLEGEIELEANKQAHNSIVGGTDRGRYPMAQLQPRQFSGKAKTPSVVLQLVRDSLDKLLVMREEKGDPGDSFGDGLTEIKMDAVTLDEEDDVDWMTTMLQSEIFSGMPTANIHQLFGLLEPIDYKTGDFVIKQGDSGEHYYIIQEGRREVLRKPPSGGNDLKLADLRPGDGFGEEALITETTRNATIKMTTDGVVGQLSKDDFVKLIQTPVLKNVSTEKAKEIVDSGGKWLDVRFKNEHDRSTIDGSEHIPLNILRMQAEKLDQNTQYVLLCDTGGRSSTGAFLLSERGFNVHYLDGGLVNHPELAPSEDVTQAPRSETKPTAKEPPKSEAKVEKKASAPVSEAKAEAQPDDDMDPEIKATVLDAELTRTNIAIEKIKKESNEKDKAEVAKRLEQERAKIESAKKVAVKEAQELRDKEEAKLKKLTEDAEKRLQGEKQKK